LQHSSLLRRLRFQLGLRLCCRRLDGLRLLVLDVDGVLTDGGLYYGSEGEPLKRFDVRDGLGIRLIQSLGIEVACLSGGRGGATQLRAAHLGIRHVLVGIKDKAAAIVELAALVGVAAEQTAYVGDDLNDLVVRDHVGLLLTRPTHPTGSAAGPIWCYQSPAAMAPSALWLRRSCTAGAGWRPC